MNNQHLITLWTEGRTRFTNILAVVTEQDLLKRLPPSPNSAGFLIRHIGDVEMLFAKNIFQLPNLEVHAKTVIAQRDTGEWTNLTELKEYARQSEMVLHQAIGQMSENNWSKTVTTKEFGTKTLAEALGRIITHTAYHAGQLTIIIKYGSAP